MAPASTFDDALSDAERSRRPTQESFPPPVDIQAAAKVKAVQAVPYHIPQWSEWDVTPRNHNAQSKWPCAPKPAVSSESVVPIVPATLPKQPVAPPPKSAKLAAVRRKASGSGKTQDDTAEEKADAVFLEAVKRDDVSAVQDAVARGQAIDVAGEDGTTAVALASGLEKPTILELLLASEPDVTYANANGDVALTHAVRMNRTAATSALLATGRCELLRKNPSSGYSLLHEAAWVGNLEVAQLLLATRAFEGQLEERDAKGATALHLAAFRATPPFCKLLVDHGAQPDAREKTTRWIPQDAAQIAEKMGKRECAMLLRELSVAMNAVKFGSRLKMKAKSAEAVTDASQA